jgi:hypothetical protein
MSHRILSSRLAGQKWVALRCETAAQFSPKPVIAPEFVIVQGASMPVVQSAACRHPQSFNQ